VTSSDHLVCPISLIEPFVLRDRKVEPRSIPNTKMEPSSVPPTNDVGIICAHTHVHEKRVLDVFYDRNNDLFVFTDRENEEIDSAAPWLLDAEWGPYKRIVCPHGCGEIGKWYRWLPSSLSLRGRECAFENIICYKIGEDFRFWESFNPKPFPEDRNGVNYFNRQGFLKGIGVERAFQAMTSCRAGGSASEQLSEFVDIVRTFPEWLNQTERLALAYLILYNSDMSTIISDHQAAELGVLLVDDITSCIGHVDPIKVLKPATITFRFLMYGAGNDKAGDLLQLIEPIADNAFWNSCAAMYDSYQDRLDFLVEHLDGEWQADSVNTLRGSVLSADDLHQYIALLKSLNLPLTTRLRCIYSLLNHCFELNLEFDNCADWLEEAGILDGVDLGNGPGEVSDASFLDFIMCACWIAASRRDINPLIPACEELVKICGRRGGRRVGDLDIVFPNVILAAVVLGVREPQFRNDILELAIDLLTEFRIFELSKTSDGHLKVNLLSDINASLEVLAVIFLARLVPSSRKDFEVVCGWGKSSRGHRVSASTSSHAPPMQNAIHELLDKDPEPNNPGMFWAPGNLFDIISDEQLWGVLARVLEYRQFRAEDKKHGFEDSDFPE
jgi:hypothetical protein